MLGWFTKLTATGKALVLGLAVTTATAGTVTTVGFAQSPAPATTGNTTMVSTPQKAGERALQHPPRRLVSIAVTSPPAPMR